MNVVVEQIRRVVRPLRGKRDGGLPPGPNLPEPVQLALWLYRPFPFLTWCRKRFGPTFSLRFPGRQSIVAFTEPDDVKEIFTGPTDVMFAGEANRPLGPIVGASSLLLLDGPRHLRERKLLLPPFHGARMHRYGEVMRDITLREMERWPVGRAFEIHPPMQAITLDVILRTVFGVDEGARFEALRAGIVELTNGFTALAMVPALQKDLGPRSPWGRFVRARANVDELLYAQIAERRRESDTSRDDILSLLLSARYEDGSPMTDLELRDELMTLLAAGHETTATALPWVFHYLTKDAGVQARLHEELDRVVGAGPVDPSAANELPYLDAVIKETMRLRPVIAAVGRVLQEPRRIGGWEIPAGTLVSPSIYLTHRNEKVWPRASRFDPSRFLDTQVSPYAYLPFGGGVRRCIGLAFAHYEMRIVLATVLSRFRVRARGDVHIRPQRRGVSLAPSHGMPVILEGR